MQNKILLKHKERLQNANYNLEELRNRALNFQIESSDGELGKLRNNNHATGIRTFRVEKPVYQKYQYLGNIMDLQYAKIKQQPEVQQIYQSIPSRNSNDSRSYDRKKDVLFEKLVPNEYKQVFEAEKFPFYRSISERDIDRQKYRMEKFDAENLSNVPSNIKHRFGSKVTDELLSEQGKVNSALASLESKQGKVRVLLPSDKQVNDPDAVVNLEKKNEENNIEPLEDISNYLRSAICHGLPMKKHMTSKQLIHSAFVNKQHLSDPNNYNSTNRRKKDWLGKSNEFCVLFQP